MIMLPASFGDALEVAALAYACERVRMVRDEEMVFFGLPLHWFDKLDNRRFARERLKGAAKDPQGMIDLANLARAGWDLAHEALCELIQEYGHRAESMPIPLQAYNMEIVDPRRDYHRLRGKKKSDRILRDIAITAIVGDVCWKFSLPPTRQRASKRDRPCGCKIVAQALRNEKVCMIGEDAVVAVWTKYGRIAFPTGIAGLGPWPL